MSLLQIWENIDKRFLDDVDSFIGNNWRELKCSDVDKMYVNALGRIKEKKGNRNGFAGLTELVIMRLLLHQLSYDFKSHEVKGREEKCFVPKTGEPICVAPEPNFGKGNKPDIIIYEPFSLSQEKISEIKRLFSVIEIKTSFNRGMKDADIAYKKLAKVHEKHPQCKVLLLAYTITENGSGKSIYRFLNGKNSKWFTFCALRDNTELLSQIFDKSLSLERMRRK